MFVTLEGIEGSGKSTLLDGLTQRARAAGREVVTAREPGGTPVGDAVRSLFLHADLTIGARSEALLINASRAALVAQVIRPALEAGRVVICDRYDDSTLAYQGYGRGLDLAMLRAVCDAATGGLRPALTLLLDLPAAIAIGRARTRGAPDRMEREPHTFYERVRDGYLALAREEPQRWRVLDATRPAGELLDTAANALLAMVRS